MRVCCPINTAWLARLSLAALLGLVAGCKTPSAPGTGGPVFYPPPPAAPRLQFLTSYSSGQDLGGGPGKYAVFVVGKEPVKQPIGKPYGVALRHNKLYVCDTAATAIDILDCQTRQFRFFTPAGEGQFASPVNIAVDHDDTRYVADTARGQVLIYGADDSFRGAIGERVNAPAKAHAKTTAPAPRAAPADTVAAMKPTDVLIAGDRLYVADLKNRCVRVYDKARRELLFTIPRDATAADAQTKLFGPTNLAGDSQGRVYVSDFGGFRVQQYDADGKYVRTFGQGAGDRPGEFARPKGVAVDRAGRLYVVDGATQVVQIFDAGGRLLLYFGEPQGKAPGLDLPAKVAIDYDHIDLFASYAAPGFKLEYLVLVTNQYGDRKVSVFGFGHKE
jgi:sugar lactone lactonase YvrE